MTTETVYVANDGKVFSTEAACTLYEKELQADRDKLCIYLHMHPDLYWGDICAGDVVQVLLDKYNVTLK